MSAGQDPPGPPSPAGPEPPGSPLEGTVSERTTCARHRNVETALRCPSCGTPICPKCLVHTPVGAKCPPCARGPRLKFQRVEPRAYLWSGAAGLGVALLGGTVLSVVPLGALMFLPLILIGWLVGEAVSAAAQRKANTALGVIAFTCATVGPILGQAAMLAPRIPIADPTLRANVALAIAVQSLGPSGLLLLLVAGVIAATRVQRG